MGKRWALLWRKLDTVCERKVGAVVGERWAPFVGERWATSVGKVVSVCGMWWRMP